MRERYDVIAVGAGTAGVVAAVQAARAGAGTLLVEKNGAPGGTMTAAGVNFPGLFHAHGRQVIAGIGWELVCRTLEATGRPIPGPPPPDAPHWHGQVRINRAVFAAVCDQALLDAGAELLYHAMPYAVHDGGGDGWQVDLATKTGPRSLRCRVLIDATGDANAVSLAHLPVVGHATVQPGTLAMQCGGYDPERLDYATIDAAVERAIADGELELTDIAWGPGGVRRFLAGRGRNHNHVPVESAETSEGRTRIEIAARGSMLRVLRFFRRQRGLADFTIDWAATECGIRESVSIRGKATITGADYIAGRRFDDAVCYSFYPIDMHLDAGRGVDCRPLAPGIVPTVPRGALLPAGSRFLLAAGRCISADREAQSACRVQATCMAIGQAAGAMAALSARQGADPEELDLPQVRRLLARHGAVVPG